MTFMTKGDEWRAMWPLPFVALLGMAGSGIAVYSTGVFMGELTREFGWSKTQYTSAMTVQLLISLFMIPLVGRAVDRFGPRRVALTGIVPTILSTALLGLANGELWQWWLLAIIQTLGAMTIVPPVWITAVVGRFHHSRGLALAFALAGIGTGTALWPILAAFYIEQVGWRLAYGAMAVSWGVLILPLTIFFFYGPRDIGSAEAAVKPKAPPYLHHLKSRTFICLAAAAGLFVCATHAMTLHLVPILRDEGMTLGTAAMMAGLAGTFSIVGRVATGFLLDTVPVKLLGAAVFLLPILVSAMLWQAEGAYAATVAAVVILGLAMGAESDVLTYIASRRFENAVFGSVYAVVQTVTAVFSIVGTLMAGALYDYWGSYDLFLATIAPLAILGAACLLLVPDDGPQQ